LEQFSHLNISVKTNSEQIYITIVPINRSGMYSVINKNRSSFNKL